MPIEHADFGRFASLVGAVSVIVSILLGGMTAIPAGWDNPAHFAAFSLLTLLLWRATAGAMPLAVVAAVILLGGLDEWREASMPGRLSDARGFLTDLCAAIATGALLFMQRKAVAASRSHPGPRAEVKRRGVPLIR